MKSYEWLLIMTLLFVLGCASTHHKAVGSDDTPLDAEDWDVIIYYNVLLPGSDYPLYGALLVDVDSIDSLSSPDNFLRVDDLLCTWHRTAGYLLDGSSVTVSLIPDSIKKEMIIRPSNANLAKLYKNLATKDYSFSDSVLSCKVGMVRSTFFNVSTISSLLETSDTFYETNVDCPVEYRFITDLAEVLPKKVVQSKLDRGLFRH